MLFEHYSLVPRARIVFGDGSNLFVIESHHFQGAKHFWKVLQEMALNNLSDDVGCEGFGGKLGTVSYRDIGVSLGWMALTS